MCEMSRIAIKFKDLKEEQVFNLRQDGWSLVDRVIKGKEVLFASGNPMHTQEYVCAETPDREVWIDDTHPA